MNKLLAAGVVASAFVSALVMAGGSSKGVVNKMVAIKGMAGVEHLLPDGSFAAYLPRDPVPSAIQAGDRLRMRIEVAEAAWIYAVAVRRQAEYWKLGAWAPGAPAGPGVRLLWPGGRTLTADDVAMTTLLVVASTEELPWLRDLARADCGSLSGTMPANPPVTACDHLYGLFWKIPKRPRGLVPPKVDFLQDDAARIPAIVAEHRGAPYTAIEWQFKPRS